MLKKLNSRILNNVGKRLPCLILFSSLAIAQTPITATSTTKPVSLGKLSLQEAVLLAIRNNPALMSSELDRVNTKYAVIIARHQFDPIWTLTSNVTQTQTTSSGLKSSSESLAVTPGMTLKTQQGTTYTASMTNPAAEYYNPQISLNIVQPLLQGFNTDVIMNNLLSSISQDKISRITFRSSVMTTIVRVIQDYRAIISAQEQVKLQQINYQNTLLNIKNNDLQIKVGNIAPSENVQAKSQLPQQQYTIVSAKNSIIQAKLTLLQDLGLSPDITFDVDNTINIPKIKLPTLKQAIIMALKNDVTYNSDLMNRKQLERNLIIAKDALRWQLNLNVTATGGGGSGGSSNAGLPSLINNENKQTQTVLNLTVPLDLITLKQAVVSAQVALQQNTIALRNDTYTVKNNVINQYITLQSQQKQLTFAEQAVQLNQQVLGQSQKKQTFGQASQFEVNQNRSALLTSQITLLSSRISYLNSVTQFGSLIGTTLEEWHLKIRY